MIGDFQALSLQMTIIFRNFVTEITMNRKPSMGIEEQFNIVAKEYDGNRRKFIPCFDDFYGNTTRFIASNIPYPQRVADLGAGTGLLSQFWFGHFPLAEYVLTDVAEEMLDVAKRRFLGKDNVTCIVQDYTDKLPDGLFDVMMSALSVHHLEDEDKMFLFHRIYDRLPENGLFVNYDQFCAGQMEMEKWYNSYWESQLATSGLTKKDITLWLERKKFDRECSVEQEIEMLSRSGFPIVKCVYAYQKFAVIVAKK